MHFDDWMRYGIDQGWCGPPVCSTHDGIPTSAVEDDAWEDYDPCIHVARLYEDNEVKVAVEANHSPSVWRDHYSTTDQARSQITPILLNSDTTSSDTL